ncbi:hypothetical protein V6N13_087989 [Hibiscus sabdariffa]
MGVSNAEGVGCGGVLSLGGGEIWALFAGPLQRSDATITDLSAIKMALEVFIEAGFADQFELFIETPSLVVVNWLQNSFERPWSKWMLLAEIDKLVYNIANVRFEVFVDPSNHVVSKGWGFSK